MVNVKNLLSEKARISLFSAGFTLIFSIEWTIYTFPFIHIPPETIRIIPFEFTPIIIELLFFFPYNMAILSPEVQPESCI